MSKAGHTWRNSKPCGRALSEKDVTYIAHEGFVCIHCKYITAEVTIQEDGRRQFIHTGHRHKPASAFIAGQLTALDVAHTHTLVTATLLSCANVAGDMLVERHAYTPEQRIAFAQEMIAKAVVLIERTAASVPEVSSGKPAPD